MRRTVGRALNHPSANILSSEPAQVMPKRTFFFSTSALLAAIAFALSSAALGLTTNRAAEFFVGYDTNRDGKIDRAEWTGRGNFDVLDTNRDGALSVAEFSAIYESNAVPSPLRPILADSSPLMDTTLEKYQIEVRKLSRDLRCAITRFSKCEDGVELAKQRGLIETGLAPLFPEGSLCQGVDESYAMSYTEKAGREASHGGIDIPAAFDVPILAAAAGTVVGIFDEEEGNARGRTLVLRHTPEDTGLPFWTYTEYAHFNAMPKFLVGQRVRMGEILGPTGNSGNGVGKKGATKHRNNRRPGIHFAVYYAQDPRFAVWESYAIPFDGNWMDSNAFYRNMPPYDSESMKSLPAENKFVPIPVLYADGDTNPPATKRIWPYPCKRVK